MEGDIAFAAYLSEALENQLLNSEFSHGDQINRLSQKFSIIEVKKQFHDCVSEGSRTRELGVLEKTEKIFLVWLYTICEKFMDSQSSYIFIIDSRVFLPISFEELIEESFENLNDSWDAISIYPTNKVTIPNAPTANFLWDSAEVNRLCFGLTRDGARKILSYFGSEDISTFMELLKISKLTCATIDVNHEKRPWVWIDLENSYQAYISNEWIQSGKLGVFLPENTGPSEVQAYISHWYATWENVANIEEACKEMGLNPAVLNTTDQHRDGWINEVPISFFSQIEIACNRFDFQNEYLLFITADVKSDLWKPFLSDSLRKLSESEIGTYSPNLSYEFFMLHQHEPIYFSHDNPFAQVKMNDVIVTFINRQVIRILKDFFIYFRKHENTFEPVVGFLICEIISNIVFHLGLKNVRDRRYTLRHPRGTSYDIQIARKETNQIRAIAIAFFENWDRRTFYSLTEMPI